MDDFLSGFAGERQALLDLVHRADTAWTTFRRRQLLDVDTTPGADGVIAGELAAVRREVTARHLSVGVFGLIKRGKSTILNALVGHAVSATHATPETAVPVFVDAGHRRSATVHFADGRSLEVDLEDHPRFTSQKSQPDERLGVAYVHARVPSNLLAAGVRMIDTPGLDDADVDESYTARTLQQLEAVDAGVVVVMSPPTVGATEIRFLQELARRNGREFVVVCNMVPQHFHDPLARHQIVDYIADRLGEAGLQVRLHAVCAVEAWEARRNGDAYGWERSGAGQLLRDLEQDLTVRAGRRAVDAACDRLQEALRLAAAEVQLQRSLLASPETVATYRDDAQERIAAFGRDTQAAVDH
ncbi:MAG TPA: dynamin family protein, partial [Nitriliruptorales bacterium]|nr:dynamin family protein [Nitriliruptorales bacterium]